jgi:hypothetical protein
MKKKMLLINVSTNLVPDKNSDPVATWIFILDQNTVLSAMSQTMLLFEISSMGWGGGWSYQL